MKPVLFQVPTPFGTFPVSSFGIFLLLAFIAAIVLTRARTRRLGWDGGEVLDLALYAIIGGIIGARIGYVLVNFKDFAAVPARAVMIWVDAGLTLYGGLAGGAIVAWAYGRRRGWTLGQIADAAAPGVALGYAVAMVGALLYGLNYGRPAHVPWAVMLFGEPRHPTQLYLAAAALIVCAILLAVDRGVWGSGRLFWLFVLLMAVARVAVEPFMDSARAHGVTLAQGVNALAAIVAAVIWLTRRTDAAAKADGREGREPGMASAPPAAPPAEPPLAPPDVGGSHS